MRRVILFEQPMKLSPDVSHSMLAIRWSNINMRNPPLVGFGLPQADNGSFRFVVLNT